MVVHLDGVDLLSVVQVSGVIFRYTNLNQPVLSRGKENYVINVRPRGGYLRPKTFSDPAIRSLHCC